MSQGIQLQRWTFSTTTIAKESWHPTDTQVGGRIRNVEGLLKAESSLDPIWVSSLNADAAIVTKDGGGQADVDIMLCCKSCENLGVKTVLLVKEEAGEDGSGFCLVDIADEADAIVTTGNGTERLQVATHVDQVIGGEKFYDGTDAKSPEIYIPYNTIVGAVDFQGGIKIAAMNY